MSEMGELFNEWNKHKKAKRQSNTIASTRLLEENGIPFESKNDGAHLIVKSEVLGLIDFWPSTGKYIVRRSQRKGRGVKNLIKTISRRKINDGEM